MKNLFKFGFIALALSLSVVACSEKTAENTDTLLTDSGMVTTTVDTLTNDTTITDTLVETTTTTTTPAN